MKVNKDEIVLIPKGSVVTITNPDFDEYTFKTHKSVEVILLHDMCFRAMGDFKVKE